MTRSADDLVADARTRIGRTTPDQVAAVLEAGGLIVDIRPEAQRRSEGDLPGAMVIERNVLEWRLDPHGAHRISAVTGFDQPVVVACSAGYASSLAADSLRALGFERATDLVGGFQAWASWRNSLDPVTADTTASGTPG